MQTETISDSLEQRKLDPVSAYAAIGAATFAFLTVAAGVCAVFATALDSGGHTGSEMSLLAHSMTLRSALAIFLAIGGVAAVFFGLILNLKKWSMFVLVAGGLLLCTLAAYTLIGVYADFGALETASRCGTYDRYC